MYSLIYLLLDQWSNRRRKPNGKKENSKEKQRKKREKI